MKICLLLLAAAFWLFAAQVEIVAKRFDGDEKSGVSKFYGDVKVTKGDDVITADTIFVYFDKDKKPLRFEAAGNASFKSSTEGKNFNAHADSIKYDIVKQEYVLTTNAFVEYVQENRKVYGDTIVVNDSTKKAVVQGNDKKPARFIFQLEDKKTNNTK